MNATLEEQLTEVLARRAAAVDVSPDPGFLAAPMATVVPLASRPDRPVLKVVAGVAAAVALIGGLVALTHRPGARPPTPGADASVTTVVQPQTTDVGASVTTIVQPPTAPLAALTLFPVVGDQAGAGDHGMYSMIAAENPAKVTALLAKGDDRTITDGIAVMAVDSFDGHEFELSTKQEITIHGVAATLYSDPTGSPVIPTVVLQGSPIIEVTGLDPVAFLELAGPDVIRALQVASPQPGHAAFTLGFGLLPEGYRVVVAPFEMPRGSIEATVVVGATESSDGTFVGSSLFNGMARAATAGDLVAVDINGVTGWQLQSPGNPVFWEPLPGMFLSVGGTSTPEEALTVARAARLVDETTWRAFYDVPAPEF